MAKLSTKAEREQLRRALKLINEMRSRGCAFHEAEEGNEPAELPVAWPAAVASVWLEELIDDLVRHEKRQKAAAEIEAFEALLKDPEAVRRMFSGISPRKKR